MNMIIVFLSMLGGVGLIFLAVTRIRTIISPRKFIAIESYLESGNVKAAMRLTKMLLVKNERNPNAHWYLGECYRAENRPDLAVEEYKYITNTGNYSNIATERKAREKLAEVYLKLGLTDESQKEYILLSKIDPNNYEYYFFIAKLFEERDYTDSALTNYKRVISINPTHAEAYLRIGVIYFRKQLYGEAKKSLMTALKYDAQNPSCYYYLGRVSAAMGDTATALAHFEKAQSDPNLRQKALLEKANIFVMKNDIQHAVFDLERALKMGDEDTPVVLALRYQLGRCYEMNKELLKAIEQWEAIYEKNPKYGDVAEKLSVYNALRADDLLKDFLTASQSKFEKYCTRIVESMGLAVQDVFLKNQDLIEVFALETQSRWRNAKKAPSVVRIFRSPEAIDYNTIRGLYDQMRKMNALRSICITASKFTRSAIEFAQIRPIDLIDKEELTKLLHTIPVE